ncbi:MAG: beta-hydroxyacyl-ACP dehydratase [Pirellula sp.]|jgi:3-hydroxyacyl-[acyl-carrier-protein] dehydratase|nr:beta-hydroxyacyl-ACP dehydratase [Pirellula sp.]
MRFKQLDKITELIPGKKIVAVREVHAGEDYFRDHFPLFAVMPGVLMLESIFQASCWLIRATENFENSLLTLREAKNVKFVDFMQPGQTLVITAEIVKIFNDSVSIKASGTKGDGDTVAVSARLTIGKENLKTKDAALESLDAFMRDSMRQGLKGLLKDDSDAQSDGRGFKVQLN